MNGKKILELATELLSNSRGYVGGEPCLVSPFDFIVDDRGIFVFSADKNDHAFFWPEVVVHIADTLRLSSYVDIQEYEKGKTRVGMRIA